jgi:hypothetical protein
MPPLVLRYFWFFGAAVMLINVLTWRRRLMSLVDRGIVTKSEVDRFITWAGIWFVGGPISAGLIAVAAGWSTPFCAGMVSFADIPRSLIALLTIASWVALLWWVWRGNGADFLARIGPALARPPRQPRVVSPALIRVGITAFVGLTAITTPILWRTMPRSPEMDCPALPKAT